MNKQEHLDAIVLEALRCRCRIEAEQEAIEDLRDHARTDLKLDPKTFNKLVALTIEGDTSWLT
jgi:cobalamin biosynthesis protein CbiG